MIWNNAHTKTFIFMNFVLILFSITGVFPPIVMSVFIVIGAALLITATMINTLLHTSKN